MQALPVEAVELPASSLTTQIWRYPPPLTGSGKVGPLVKALGTKRSVVDAEHVAVEPVAPNPIALQ